MALGDTYTNGSNNKKENNVNTYSPYAFTNAESKIDTTAFNTTFWNRMLILSIIPIKVNGDNIEFDKDNAGKIYLTHIKAKMLRDEIVEYLKDPMAYNNLGVPSGAGLISISNGKDVAGKVVPMITIRMIDESGKPTASYAYEFKTDYHYSIRNYDDKGEFDKVYYKDYEIDALIVLLEEYYKAMTGAVAHSVMEFGKFQNDRTKNSLNAIAEKLGVDTGFKKTNSFKSTSAFNNGGRNVSTASSSNKSLEDIENDFED